MKLNRVYKGPAEMPDFIPVFPLAGALLLPRRPLQLNIFEPRYLSLIDDALTGDRLIGMIQPSAGEEASDRKPDLCAVGCVGRLVQYAEIGDGRCMISLNGVARFRVMGEAGSGLPYRLARASFDDFAADFNEGEGEALVDRESLLRALRTFAEANKFKIDWDDIEQASNEALVNGLSMISPYGAKEKQALLEAADLKARAEMLVAITQMELVRSPSTSTRVH